MIAEHLEARIVEPTVGRQIIVETGTVRLNTWVAGSGPLVILMHGWPELGLSYRHQISALANAGYMVAAPDMRGYGSSSKPEHPSEYSTDASADDMAAIASALGAKRWVAVGHDWGVSVATRCALRFPEDVSAVFLFSIPHRRAPSMSAQERFAAEYPNRFFYMRYFQPVGLAEAELDRDVRYALKRIFFALSGDAPLGEWTKHRPPESRLLDGLAEPLPEPLSFMSDTELDYYAEQFSKGGFRGPLNWYRAMDTNSAQAKAYGERLRQPTGFLCGEKEIALVMIPNALERQRELCDDLRMERIIPGAGHWVQQERPNEVSSALLEFLNDVKFEL